jgi:hypothetical protein
MILKTVKRWAIPSVLALGALGFSACGDDDDDDDEDTGDMDAGTQPDDGTDGEEEDAGGQTEEDAGPLTCGDSTDACEGATVPFAGQEIPLDPCCAGDACGISIQGDCYEKDQPGEFSESCTAILAGLQAAIDAMQDAGVSDGGVEDAGAPPNGLIVEFGPVPTLNQGCCIPGAGATGTCGLDSNGSTLYPSGEPIGAALGLGCVPLPAEVVAALGGSAPVCEVETGDAGAGDAGVSDGGT